MNLGIYTLMRYLRTGTNVVSSAAIVSSILTALLFSGFVCAPYAIADEQQIQRLQAEMKKSGGDAASAKKLGRAYLEVNKIAEACKVFEDLADKYPADAEAHYLYGEALMSSKKYAESAIELKRASNLDANKPTYVLRTGEALLAAGRYDELTELTNAALSKSPDAGTKETLDWLAKLARERKNEFPILQKVPHGS